MRIIGQYRLYMHIYVIIIDVYMFFLSSEEPLAGKFGYAPFTTEAQACGVILLSPLMYRIPTGTAYFLFYVDKELTPRF